MLQDYYFQLLAYSAYSAMDDGTWHGASRGLLCVSRDNCFSSSWSRYWQQYVSQQDSHAAGRDVLFPN